MRLKVRLPKVEPDEYTQAETCPYGCGGKHYKPHGVKGERKLIRDIGYTAVISYRYQCVRCKKTFRVYPQGISKGAQQSQRLQAMTVLLYVLGLSYGAIEDFTHALGCGVGKVTAYNNVQAAGVQSRSQQQARVRDGGKRAVIGADGTYVKVKGKRVGIEVVVDDQTGELLGLDIITSENGEEIREIIQEVVTAVGAEVLVSDGHGAYQEVVDETGVAHQICRNHTKRNVDALAVSLNRQLLRERAPPPGSNLLPEQLQTDLEQLQRLVRERPDDGEVQLETLYARYKDVPGPEKGARHSVWYRMRMLITRLWNRWRDLTLDLRRNDLDGTNNCAERLIGWWIKERYRTMRAYKRQESIKNVVTLTAHIGAFSGYYDMTELFA